MHNKLNGQKYDFKMWKYIRKRVLAKQKMFPKVWTGKYSTQDSLYLCCFGNNINTFC